MRTEITHRATSAAWRILAAVEGLNRQHSEKLESDSKILAIASTRKSRLIDQIAEIIEGEFSQGEPPNAKDNLPVPIRTAGPARVGPAARPRKQAR